MSFNPVQKYYKISHHIDCKIEGEKNVLSYWTSINMAQIKSGKDIMTVMSNAIKESCSHACNWFNRVFEILSKYTNVATPELF